VPVDPNDPPTFESQAAYLKRLGLLLPGEEKRLAPKAFAPERIEPNSQHSREEGSRPKCATSELGGDSC